MLEKDFSFPISFIIAESFSRDSDLQFSLGHRGSYTSPYCLDEEREREEHGGGEHDSVFS